MRTLTHYVREARVTWQRRRAAEPLPRKVNTPAAAYEYAREILPLDDPREHFAVIALNTRHEALGYYVTSIGTADAALVHPAEVFRFALLSHAVSVALAHTHPSGDPQPSTDDVHLTRRMVEAGAILGITVLDHVIIGCPTTDAPPRYHALRESAPQLFR